MPRTALGTKPGLSQWSSPLGTQHVLAGSLPSADTSTGFAYSSTLGVLQEGQQERTPQEDMEKGHVKGPRGEGRVEPSRERASHPSQASVKPATFGNKQS